MRLRAPSVQPSPWTSRGLALAVGLTGTTAPACATVDLGPDVVVTEEHFDADFFACRVEPLYLTAKGCGGGDPAAGDRPGGCHFNGSAVSGMALVEHAPVDCGGGDRPLSGAALATAAVQANLQSVSLVMSRDVATAPLVTRPTGPHHPRVIFTRDDPVVDILRAWAARP